MHRLCTTLSLVQIKDVGQDNGCHSRQQREPAPSSFRERVRRGTEQTGRGTGSIFANHRFMRDSIIMRESKKELGSAVVEREWGASKGQGQEQEMSYCIMSFGIMQK